MNTNQTIDGVPRELLERIAESGGFVPRRAELRALLDAPAPPGVAVGRIEQRRSMGLAIGSPITNVIWELPHPELKQLPDGAKLYLHPATQSQGEPVAWLSQCKDSGLVEQAEPNEKASNPDHWTDAFPVFRAAPAIKLHVNVSNVKVTLNADGSYSVDSGEQPAPVAVVIQGGPSLHGQSFIKNCQVTCCGSCPGGCVIAAKP